MKRVRKPRWRCELCIAFGFATTGDKAFADLEKHYQSMHMGSPVTVHGMRHDGEYD